MQNDNFYKYIPLIYRILCSISTYASGLSGKRLRGSGLREAGRICHVTCHPYMSVFWGRTRKKNYICCLTSLFRTENEI